MSGDLPDPRATALADYLRRRAAVLGERDAAYRANTQRKEELLARAEAIEPERDVEGARNALREIQAACQLPWANDPKKPGPEVISRLSQ